MFNRIFSWKRRQAPLIPEGGLRYDVHCHLMPGVDDGCASEDETVICIQGLIALGYRGALLTPHIHQFMFPNDEGYLRERFRLLEPRMREQFPEFKLALGAEYLLDEVNWETLNTQPEKMLTFGPAERPHVLFELRPDAPGDALLPVLDRVAELGWTLVIAHIERYDCVCEEGGILRAADWAQRGALLQVNLGSFAGSYGKRAQATAGTLLQSGLIHLLGTDLHRPSQLKSKRYRKAWAVVASSEPIDLKPIPLFK